jgi:hypothetical protein
VREILRLIGLTEYQLTGKKSKALRTQVPLCPKRKEDESANVKTLLLESSQLYFASVFSRKSLSVAELIVPHVESQSALEALLIQSADLRISSVFL